MSGRPRRPLKLPPKPVRLPPKPRCGADPDAEDQEDGLAKERDPRMIDRADLTVNYDRRIACYSDADIRGDLERYEGCSGSLFPISRRRALKFASLSPYRVSP